MTYGQLPEPILFRLAGKVICRFCLYAVKGGHGRRRRAA